MVKISYQNLGSRFLVRYDKILLFLIKKKKVEMININEVEELKTNKIKI